MPFAGAGAVSLREAGETTMLLGFPIWIAYAAMTPGLALTGSDLDALERA
jgi:hypothetical protein